MNAATFWLFIIKLIAPSLTLIIINKFKKNKKMRYIDTLPLPCQHSILTNAVAFAKAENIENGNDPMTNVEELAIDYCHQFGCIVPDIYNLGDIVFINAWVGARPIKQPR